jgi:hypothetical protein
MKKFSFTKIWFEPIFLNGSLAVFEDCGRCPPKFGLNLRPDSGRKKFGLFSKYSTRKEKSNFQGFRRPWRRPNRTEFWAQKSIGGFV